MKLVGTPSDSKSEEKEQGLLIHAIWGLFSNLADSTTEGLVDAVMVVACQFDFDIEILPPDLYEKVVARVKEEAEEYYYVDMVACLDTDIDSLRRSEMTRAKERFSNNLADWIKADSLDDGVGGER